MALTTFILAAGYICAVVALTAFGFLITVIAGDAAGAGLGLLIGVLSAIAWALSTIANTEWNHRLNLFAALFAACSLGFLAPTERLCGWNPLPLLCR
jgi:hypothetical protein